ncbi:prealbumin-like fold domain-containing protein [[Ruminococcus] torques]|uniref:prealbumin-like fold domain-containing protein n=1 Tax=[Ruminococcus] torques TaxID=33039 RepID=UPI0032C11A85
MIIKQTLDQAFKLGADPVILIKPEDNSDENIKNINLSIPYIERGGLRIEILKDQDATMIQSTNIDGAYLDYDKLTDEIFPVRNVSSSGYVRCGLGTDNVLWYYGTAENAETDMSTIGSSSMKFLINHMIRIYVKVKPEPAETKLTLTKTVAGTDEGRFRPVKDAKFKLYKAVRDEEGNFVKGELYQPDEYITDEEGKINFSTEIPNGDYCFAETEAPEGFELNSDPVFFSVGGGEMEITGGEQTVTPTEGESTSAGENSTYIDRYSPDVNIKVTPGTGMVLDQIIVTYFDRKTQKNTGKTFTNETGEAAKNAAEFINKGKGDEKEAGVIDGTVTVQPIYRLKANLTVGNDREKTDFVFKKVSAEDQTVMEGVRFKLTCNHKHDKKCKGLISPESCTHAHNDKTGFVDEQGCTWSAEEVSKADGIVKFSELVSGEYILSKEATLDGFILPEGTWTVTVDAHKDEVKVEKTEKDDSTVPQFEKKDGILQVENEPTVPFSFIKVDEKTGNELAGAEFTLYQGDENDADKWSIVGGPVVSSEEGIVDFGRLKQGEYFLKETKAPKGYLKPTGYWKVTIAVTDDASKKVTFEARGDVPAISGNHIEGFKVSNRETSLLPKMGGNGTKIFVFSGFMIICCSLVLYFRFKRKGA